MCFATGLEFHLCVLCICNAELTNTEMTQRKHVKYYKLNPQLENKARQKSDADNRLNSCPKYGTLAFQSYCLTLITKLNAAVRGRSATGSIVAAIKSLASSFSSVSFVHVSHSANEVAHMFGQIE